MEQNKNEFWSDDIHSNYHPPKGTFTQNAPEVVKTLLSGANGDAIKALHRLVFYINRAGSKLTNEAELTKAKALLEELIQNQKS